MHPSTRQPLAATCLPISTLRSPQVSLKRPAVREGRRKKAPPRSEGIGNFDEGLRNPGRTNDAGYIV
ncbi:hypothetical protein E2C01_094287 [Portunus trituberculatus]|uniref:Uncharacterized protein n=1 Tax=Portunus trituberculatus TaxID=210409 RepID=A0A5B7JLH0_PORTR|nr:hypothetical protein [Portunus trituberculatus]